MNDIVISEFIDKDVVKNLSIKYNILGIFATEKIKNSIDKWLKENH